MQEQMKMCLTVTLERLAVSYGRLLMSDRYIMSLYTYCLSARKAVALENIEMEGLSEAELAMVKLERVREVLFQALLLDDVKFEDGKMYAEFCTVYLLE